MSSRTYNYTYTDADLINIIDDIYIVSLPPAYVYVEIRLPKFWQLDGLDQNVILILSQQMYVTINQLRTECQKREPSS